MPGGAALGGGAAPLLCRRSTVGRVRAWPRSRWLILSVAVVIIALGLAAVLGYSLSRPPAGETEQPPPSEANRADFVQYRDPKGRFAVSYPADWSRVQSSDPQVALLVRAGPESQDSMLVRIVPLAQPVGPDQLAQAKKITDDLVQGSDVEVVVEQQIEMDGVPGYYYLYTFGKPGSDRFGIHAHYFLFNGSTMHVLVFQALPDTHFVDLAPTFDRIARSYQVQPAPASGTPAPDGG